VIAALAVAACWAALAIPAAVILGRAIRLANHPGGDCGTSCGGCS
jgi:hypothetical protein